MGLVESSGFVGIYLFEFGIEVLSGGLNGGEWRGGLRELPLVRIIKSFQLNGFVGGKEKIV